MKTKLVTLVLICFSASLLFGGVKPNPDKTHRLTVVNGTGGGDYLPNTEVTVTAAAGGANGGFSHWTATGLALTDAQSKANPLTIAMPGNDVTLTANFIGGGQVLSLSSGWNWVGFQQLPTSHKVGDVLGTAGFMANDAIQSSTGSTRFTGTSWIPSSFTIDYGKLYMVNVTNPVTVPLSGSDSGTSSLSVNAGWNWIANPTLEAAAPSQLTHSSGWTAGDRIQGVAGSVAYSGSKWIPSTGFMLEPGKGYQMKVAKGGTVIFPSVDDDALYVVVDLSGGPDAASYPVCHTNTPPNLDDDTCRTTELWLRKIPKGTFMMGAPQSENIYNAKTQHEVTLTQDYYIGIFECTQTQWELVMGGNPAEYTGICRPVEHVTYEMIRGSSSVAGGGWPTYGHAVNSGSFMGKLQTKTGLTFDLPTEAQWEYACRAGTTTALNSGNNSTVDARNEVGRNYNNQRDGKGGYTSGHTKVGSYLPNAWGVYDMHGNVAEWCLDWFVSDCGQKPVEDPKGQIEGTTRVERGCGWLNTSYHSANRYGNNPWHEYVDLGFRVFCLPEYYMIAVDNGIANVDVARRGDQVMITANAPGHGMVFDKWIGDKVVFSDARATETTFTMPSASVTLIARYVPDAGACMITVGNGIADTEAAYSGDTVTVIAKAPKYGMVFNRWIGDVEFADMTSMTTSFTMPAKPVEIMATYLPDPNALVGDALYVVVDLSNGPDAENYPVRCTDTAPNLNNDTCRTTELWLRRIPKGTFMMGAPANEDGRDSDEIQHEVTLTQDYYIGVFECTQKQWELVMGYVPWYYNPGYNIIGDCRPVANASYNQIRGLLNTAGAGWPSCGHDVDATSFMGKLRAKTGLMFDLPTDAQWEYACRAGTTTPFNSGKGFDSSSSMDANMNEVGRYQDNQSDGKGGCSKGHTKVGCYLSNAWGLYDMHGNVREWCLDWYNKYYYQAAAVTDPLGAIDGSMRVLRGGGYDDHKVNCRSAARYYSEPALNSNYDGFRIALIPQMDTYDINMVNSMANIPKGYEGNIVTITANAPADGMVFDKWVSDDVEFADATDEMTTFVMPAKNVAVTAVFKTNTTISIWLESDKQTVQTGDVVTVKLMAKNMTGRGLAGFICNINYNVADLAYSGIFDAAEVVSSIFNIRDGELAENGIDELCGLNINNQVKSTIGADGVPVELAMMKFVVQRTAADNISIDLSRINGSVHPSDNGNMLGANILDGTLDIDYGALTLAVVNGATSVSEFSIDFSAYQQTRAANVALKIGMSDGASYTYQPVEGDLIAISPIGNVYGIRVIDERRVDDLHTDIRGLANREVWNVLVTVSAGQELTLDWSEAELPDYFDFKIIKGKYYYEEEIIRMDENTSMTFTEGKTFIRIVADKKKN